MAMPPSQEIRFAFKRTDIIEQELQAAGHKTRLEIIVFKYQCAKPE
jgi:hypothetical protein